MIPAAATGRAVVLRGDARTLPLPDASVDLIVTSPPYYALRADTDGGDVYEGQIGCEATPAEYIASLLECTREWMRVLKPTGSLWVALGDKYGRPGGGADRSPRSLPRAGKGAAARIPTAAYRVPVETDAAVPWLTYLLGLPRELRGIARHHLHLPGTLPAHWWVAETTLPIRLDGARP